MAHMNDQAGEEGRRDERIRPPRFCKTVSEYSLEGGPSCWLQVPPEFVRNHLPHVDQMRTVLQNAVGETWPVQFVAEHGFVTGWAGFATGNALDIGDTLMFSFVEETKYFVVHVFAKSGCEKGTHHRDLALPPFSPKHDLKLRPNNCSGGAERPLPTRNGGHPQRRQQAEICRSEPYPSQDGPRDVAKAIEKRGNPSWRISQELARATVTKATMRKVNLSPPPPPPPPPPQKQQPQRKKKKPTLGPETDGEIGLDSPMGYHGELGGQSSLDSLRRDDKETAADLSRLRMSGRRHMDPSVPPQANSSDAGAVVTKKRKRGRPFKDLEAPSSAYSTYLTREIFLSRRRKVTQAELDLAVNSAYQHAAELNVDSTTCVMVMSHSYVYRSFVLYLPRAFAKLYMPDTKREVAMVDSAWNMWFGVWNPSRMCISGGWRNFALQHCLEEGDAVVMEILEEGPHALILKVHLFPVVPVPEGITGWHSHVCPSNSSYCDPISTGVPTDPLPRLRGKITPRPQRPRKRRVARKRVHSGSEDPFTTTHACD